MKRHLVLFLCIVVSAAASAQADFSGNGAVTINSNIPESGITDVTFSPSLTLKLDAGDGDASFSAWFAMQRDSDLYSFDLLRFSMSAYLSDSIILEAGRQNMLTGYGYGWNPIDFADPLKDPADPEAELRGVDAVTVSASIGSVLSVRAYTLLPSDLLSSGLDYRELKPGGELTLSFPGIEIKAAGIWDWDSSEGEDAYTPAFGTAFSMDIFGAGVYSEAAFRKGSRNFIPDGSVSLNRKTDWLFSALGGIEYTFPNELYGVVEYFYNGEGLDRSERDQFEPTLISLGGIPTTDLLSIYRQGYFSRQYLLVNLMQPLYEINTNIMFSMLYSIDSGALMVMPRVEYDLSGSLTLSLGYTGMVDTDKSEFTEVSALPVLHSIQAEWRYSF